MHCLFGSAPCAAGVESVYASVEKQTSAILRVLEDVSLSIKSWLCSGALGRRVLLLCPWVSQLATCPVSFAVDVFLVPLGLNLLRSETSAILSAEFVYAM